MTSPWSLAVSRADLAETRLTGVAALEPGPGEAVLHVDRVGLTANNVTYATFGETMRYWDFFPVDEGWGIVPLWGFADVVASRVDGLPEGARLYGYLPTASELLVLPQQAEARGFREVSPHRAALPSAYNTYRLTTGDPTYEEHREDLQVLFRPLFFTSWMLADQCADNAFFGADVVALSSASSKTAYGTAALLHGKGPELVGLTSPRNVAFTESLGCYDRVVAYDSLQELDPARPTAYLDLAGNAALRRSLHQHLGASLVEDATCGATHQDTPTLAVGDAGLPGATPRVFFAPDQMRKRLGDWGREGLDQRFSSAWLGFAPTADSWVDVTQQSGPEALTEVWLEVLQGRSAPRTGHVLRL
jgi:hypothetical protein